VNKKTQLALVALPLIFTVLTIVSINAGVDISDVKNCMTVEGIITEIRPNEYYSFKVSYLSNGELVSSWCTPSTSFKALYQNGEITPEETHVLALVDTSTNRGIVFDSIPMMPEPESESKPEPEQETMSDPYPEPKPAPEPEPEPSPIDLPPGLELVSMEAQPRPDLVPPEGKIKLIIMSQPANIEGLDIYPPPGVYYADKGVNILFRCSVDNEHWVFKYWNIGMGPHGSLRKTGVGYEHYIRVRMDKDLVITAFLDELV